MKFRTVCYYQIGDQRVRMTSEAFGTEVEANVLLDTLLAVPGFVGGDIETHVPGIGWVMGGTDEAESAIIMHNRREVEVPGLVAEAEHFGKILNADE